MRGRLGRREILAGVFVLAMLLRLIPPLARGGLGFWNGYDDSVYYASADALTFGDMPYRDFLLLHPPGMTVFLVPFAALGRATSDAAGMVVARCVFIAVGALNATLVAAVAWRWSRRAGVIAGFLYACWYPAVVTEQSARLEVLGTTAVLVALLLLVRLTPTVRPRHELIAGAALGLGTGVKIWGLAPWAALVLWELLRQRWGAASRLVAAGAGVLGVLLLPFFVAAPTRMVDMVVRDQFRRTPTRPSQALRLSSIFGIDNGITVHHAAVAVIVGIVLVAAMLVCLRDGLAQPILLVLAADIVVLLASPSFFRHYGELAAAPAVLVIAVATGRVSGRVSLRRRWSLAATSAAVALAGASGAAALSIPGHVHLIDGSLAASVPAGCLKSDDPGVLIQLDRLSDGFRDNCGQAVDVWGARQDVSGQAAWERYLVGYLRSGAAYVLARPAEDNLSRRTLAVLDSAPALARGGGLTIRLGRGH